MSYLNAISFAGIFGLCFVAWIFSENKRVVPWRVIIGGILLQLALGFFVFRLPATRELLNIFSGALNSVFDAADAGARFVFGPLLVPVPGREPFALMPVGPDGACRAGQILVGSNLCADSRMGYILATRALPAVIFFSALMSLLYNLGVIQVITKVFAKVFYQVMRLSGAEALSGAANIFVGIEAAIAVKPYIAKMTRSEIAAILACCFGTAASSTLAIYVSFLKPVFPNILGHLVSASIMAIPACFVLSKILVPETEVPLTAGGIDNLLMDDPNSPATKHPTEPTEDFDESVFYGEDELAEAPQPEKPMETVGGEPIERMSPLDSAILGALDGVKMAVSIAAVLILIVGFVNLIQQFFTFLSTLPDPIGTTFNIKTGISLPNIMGVLFYPITLMTGVSFNESWEASVIIGRRLLETAIPPYQALSAAAARPDNPLSDRTVLIVSYALSGFAHVASVGIFVGGTISLAPSRRKDITELGWKALFVGTLATLMIAAIAGFYDDGDPSILGDKTAPPPAVSTPAPKVAPASPPASPQPSPETKQPATPAAKGSPAATPAGKPSPAATPAGKLSPAATPAGKLSPAATPAGKLSPVAPSPKS